MEESFDIKEKYIKILLQTMKDFVFFCKENDIKYTAAYGTVLGAVRHKGLIPWDDDIDVYMTRENYEKFISKRNELKHTPYDIIYRENQNYYLPYAKFYNKKTTLWEVEELPLVIGVFIDVFPLDYVPSSKRAIENLKYSFSKYWRFYLRSISRVSRNQYITFFKQVRIPAILANLKNFIYRPFRKRIYNKLTKLEEYIKSIKGDRYIFYSHRYSQSAIYPRSWIDDSIEVPFEDFYIKIPKDYHDYLINEYGDYMQLPPKEKRISNHSFYFVDLTKKITISEIKSLNINGK